jgi:hypothetical protein
LHARAHLNIFVHLQLVPNGGFDERGTRRIERAQSIRSGARGGFRAR